MLRVGTSLGRRTVFILIGSCMLCFYLGRLSSPSPNSQQCPRHRGDDGSHEVPEPVIFVDDQAGLDVATKHSSNCTIQVSSTPASCLVTSHVSDNERPGRRGFLPAFYYQDCNLEKLGAGRGKWLVCTKGLGRDSKIFSFGISSNGGHHDVSFEKAMLDSYGSTVMLFDPLPSAQSFVSGLMNTAEGTFKEQILENKFRYSQLGLWEKDGSLGFMSNGNRTESNPAMILPVVRLTTLLCMYMPNWIDILKFDFPSHWPEALWDLDKIEEVPVDQILIRFTGHADSAAREPTIKVLKKKGFLPLGFSGNYFVDEKVTFVRAYYVIGDAPMA